MGSVDRTGFPAFHGPTMSCSTWTLPRSVSKAGAFRRWQMPRRVLAVVLGVDLTVSAPPRAAQGSAQTDTDLATGIRQVREGDFDTALITLDGVVKRLAAQKGQAPGLGRAYTY